MRKAIYIAGPYTDPTEEGIRANVESALSAALVISLELKRPVIVPHVAMDPRTPWDQAMNRCRELLSACDTIVMLPRWRESRGARQEHEWAKERGMSVLHFDDLQDREVPCVRS